MFQLLVNDFEVVSHTRHLIEKGMKFSPEYRFGNYFAPLIPYDVSCYPLDMERASRTFPNTLRLHRKMMGYSQRQVARLLGLHDTVPVSLWEKGAKLPSTVNLIQLSLIYRTYPNQLYDNVFQDFRENLRVKEGEILKTE
jgi:DNA-binding XRE family transcriptional regulator